MIVLGLTRLQQEILKSRRDGIDCADIASALNVSETDAVYEEMLAMSVMSQRWNRTELEVSKILKAILLILISLTPLVQDIQIERPMRARTSRSKTSRSGRKKINFEAMEA